MRTHPLRSRMILRILAVVILAGLFLSIAIAAPKAAPRPLPVVSAAIVFQHHFAINHPEWVPEVRPDGRAAYIGQPVEVSQVGLCRFEFRAPRVGLVHQIDFGRLSASSFWRRMSPPSQFLELTFPGDGETVQVWERLDPGSLSEPGKPIRWVQPAVLQSLTIDVHGPVRADAVIQAVRDIRDGCLPERQR